jgi:hypothetical protein
MHIYQEDPQNANSPNGTMVYNNTMTNSNIGGVYLAPGINPISDIRIDSNRFSNMPIPIMVEGGAGNSKVVNTTILRNAFSSSTYGVRAGWTGQQNYVDMLNITNNTFTSIGPYPAVLIESGTTQVTIAYNTFSSCTTNIRDNTGQALIYGNSG